MLIIEKVLLMKSSEIFQQCKETDLIEIAAVCEECYFDKGVTIFEKGSFGNCMYFIYSGKISIHDEQHQLAVLGDNEIFGELLHFSFRNKRPTAVRKRAINSNRFDHGNTHAAETHHTPTKYHVRC